MARITYLIGAGASANSLPVNDELQFRLFMFKRKVEDFISKNPDFLSDSVLKSANTLIHKLGFFNNQMGLHLTVDTYARKLFARKDHHPLLKDFKKVISTFFVHEQLPIDNVLRSIGDKIVYKQVPDARYDHLIASLLSNEIDSRELHKDVSILSWNYDIQFELSYKNFLGIRTLPETHALLQAVPGKWLNISRPVSLSLNRFSLIHLNGVAGYKNILNLDDLKATVIDEALSLIADNKERDMMGLVLKFYDALLNNDDHEEISYLNYSWETRNQDHGFKNPFNELVLKNAERIAKETEVLVVIGYTFPVFNRWLDSKLVNSMTKLKKVYIQDKSPEGISSTMLNGFKLIQQMESSSKNFIMLNNNVSQFVVPSELAL